LAEKVQAIAAEGDRRKETRSAIFQRIWTAAHHSAGLTAPDIPPAREAGLIPFLSEPWYCCAEPTREQFVSIGPTQAIEETAPAPGGYV
jgi:hypothetical protein